MPRIITPESNKKLKREYRLRFLIVLFFAIALALCLTITLLFPSYVLLDSYASAYATSKLGAQQETLERLNEEYSTKLETTHLLSQKVMRTIPQHPLALDLLVAYSSDGIELTAVEIDQASEGLTVNVRGEAATRSVLLDFEQRIKRDSRFSGFELPIEVLTKQSDISFNVTFSYHEK